MKTKTALLVSILFAAPAFGGVTKTIENTYPFAAHGTVSLTNVNGSVEINAWEKNEVSLLAELSAKTQEDLDRISVNIDAQPARLTIETKIEKRSSWLSKGGNGEVRYTLKVPAGIRLDSLRTVNSGVRISGLKGTVEAQTVNGTLRATGLAGNVELSTVNGSIEAQFDRVADDSHIGLETVNGSCELSVPPDTNARVSAGTVNGRARSEVPMTLEKSGRNKLRGTMGAGGASIELSSVNGSVMIRPH